jgi:GNAT superfamily N-acetyltransferase
MTIQPVAACSAEGLAALFATGWPAFIDADERAAAALPRIRSLFATHELAVVAGEQVLAAGWGVPLVWSGTVADLPGGYTDALDRALDDHDRARAPDTLVLGAVQVHPAAAGQGVAARLLTALVGHAHDRGLTQVIAPLRPTLKARYPLTPIAEYAAWTRVDGAPFDPWLRLHVRLGARVLGIAEASQTFTGTVAEWESWTGLVLPASGDYVVPDALAPLTVDGPADRGVCVEPGIWVQHLVQD